jgi:hypothetical protein
MKILLSKEEVTSIIKDNLKKRFNNEVKVKIINRRNGFEIEAVVIEDIEKATFDKVENK